MHGVESEAAVCPGGYRMIGIRGSRFRRNRSAAGEGVGDSLGNIFQSYNHCRRASIIFGERGSRIPHPREADSDRLLGTKLCAFGSAARLGAGPSR